MQKSTFTFLKITLSGLFIFISLLTFSQNKSYWEVNANGGTSLFFGDMKQYQWAPVSNYENEWRFGGGVQFGRQFSYVFGVRGQFLYGQLAGTRREWKRYFNADYYETNLNVTMNLNNLIGKNKRSDRFFNAYLIAGIGLTQYNSTIYELGTDKVLNKVGHGNGSGINGRTLEGILVGGLGVDFRINDQFRVTLETANRAMNSDYMDHWDNGFKYDIYNYTSVGISWRFGLKNKSRAAISGESDSYMRSYQKEDENAEKEEAGHVSFDALTIEPEEHPVMPPQTDTVVEAEVIEPEIVETERDTVETLVIPTAETKREERIEERKEQKKEEFRIQIAAKQGAPLSIEKLSDQYNIPVNEIKESEYNGYYIYTVGSYDTYEEAKEARKRIIYNNGVEGAFIVGFENGERVNVRQLLHKEKYTEGLEYRVQISARYGKPISKTKLSRMFGIPAEKIYEDRYNGFYIYTVGSFDTYKAAKDYKYQLQDEHNINGAFVVAFMNGKRLESIPLDHE